jgi:hypothetical protein
LRRDQKQRDAMVQAQLKERRRLQRDIDRLRQTHARNRRIVSKELADAIRMTEQVERMQAQTRDRSLDRGLTL